MKKKRGGNERENRRGSEKKTERGSARENANVRNRRVGGLLDGGIVVEVLLTFRRR